MFTLRIILLCLLHCNVDKFDCRSKDEASAMRVDKLINNSRNSFSKKVKINLCCCVTENVNVPNYRGKPKAVKQRPKLKFRAFFYSK